ncbi:MAG: DUF6130 family protein [Rhizomicrobium sp.]
MMTTTLPFLNGRSRPWIAACLSAVLCGFAAAPARAESPVIKINAAAAASPVTRQSLRGNISVLMGSGGNITVLTGADGKFMVDAGIAVSRQKIEAQLTEISSAPLKYLVNTHWHWDHTDGNAWAHEDGATIIALPATRRRIAATTRVDDWDYTFPPVPADGLPTVFVKSTKTMRFDGETIAIKPYVISHTDGDLSVYFKKADVLATGDTFWNGVYPFIDYSTGGGIDGMIRAADANIAMAGEHTIVVPGHGPVGTRADLVAFRDMLVAIRGKVAALKRRGLTRDQVIAAKPTAAFDAKWGQFVIDPDFFARLVYRGLPPKSLRRTIVRHASNEPSTATPSVPCAATAPSARDIRGAAPVVPLASEPPAKLFVDPPLPDSLAQDRVIIQYRAENLHIVQVFGPNALDVTPRIGHIHVTVDDAPWHWLDGSGEPVTITGLAPGPHKVLIELVTANHQVLDKQVVSFVIPQGAKPTY